MTKAAAQISLREWRKMISFHLGYLTFILVFRIRMAKFALTGDKIKNMLGTLTSEQIENVLRCQMTGRIGCYANDEIYIVPVTYAYDDGFIYAHSKEGRKVKMMRMNPKVCFQVDAIENMANWRSVIIWGQYQELKTQEEQKHGMHILANRLTPFTTSATVRRPSDPVHPKIVEKRRKPVIYRIRIEKSTGRFEKAVSL